MAIAECCIEGGLGAQHRPGAADEVALFGEGPGGVVIAGPADAVEAVPGAQMIGSVEGDALEVQGAADAVGRAAARGLRGRHPAPSYLAEATGTAGTLARRAGAVRGFASSSMNPELDHRDGPRDECGVFGVYAPGPDVARLAYFALYALQHRGQESAGIATSEGGHIMTVRDLGLVSQVFDEEKLRALQGEIAVGHVRYSTTGSSAWENAQPVWRSDRRQVALAHNGNLINAVELHAELSDARRAVSRHLGLRDHRRAALDPRGAAHRGRAGRGHAAARGRVLDCGDDQGHRRGASATRPACARSRWAGSAIAGASPRRAAPSTSSAPSWFARWRRARWSRWARTGSRRGSWSSPSAGPSACSSTSTSLARTRSSRATAPRYRGARWVRSSSARHRWRPTW